MLLPIMVKILALVEAALDRLVFVSVLFGKSPDDGQWVLSHLHTSLTNKGIGLLDAAMTVVHQGLVFLAQLVTLLPMQEGTTINTYP